MHPIVLQMVAVLNVLSDLHWVSLVNYAKARYDTRLIKSNSCPGLMPATLCWLDIAKVAVPSETFRQSNQKLMVL